jgi:hypothetical protein
MSELALDHVERHALAGHLDGVGVAKLMRGKAPSDAGSNGELAQLCADRRRRPRSSACRSVDDAEECANRHLGSVLEPGPKLLPAPVVHPDLTSLAALAGADQDRATAGIKVALGESSVKTRKVHTFLAARRANPPGLHAKSHPNGWPSRCEALVLQTISKQSSRI